MITTPVLTRTHAKVGHYGANLGEKKKGKIPYSEKANKKTLNHTFGRKRLPFFAKAKSNATTSDKARGDSPPYPLWVEPEGETKRGQSGTQEIELER